MTHYAIGICLGASSLSMVHVASQPNTRPENAGKPGATIISHKVLPHDGDPKRLLASLLEEIPLEPPVKVALTGRKFRHLANLSAITEPEAVEYALRFVIPETGACRALISAGGETFMVYVLDANGRIANVISGNKCAAGTGEFYLQQLHRMGIPPDKAAQWGDKTAPYPVSGRCSVFCKSDCTHATNKGIPKARVAAGLGKMMADKILSLLNKIECRDLMLVGGTSKNQMMVFHLKQAINGLVIPKQAPYFEALGAALWALENPTRPMPAKKERFAKHTSHFERLAPLNNHQSNVYFKTGGQARIRNGDTCLLGLDVGSTTTKAVLIRQKDSAQLASIYLRTNGDPVSAARRCYTAIHEQIGEQVDPKTVTIIGLGICGSGRQIAGLHAQTQGIINEIIAHATSALFYDPQVDTIFEIGGQDAKYTHIINGVPVDYAMNEACSAGTGSFLEESALETLGLPVNKIAETALNATQPPNFNDQCAAFIASDIKNAIHEGISQQDIVAGLVYSICMNYDNRVRGNRPIGKKIFMQGGVCYNQAVPLAMAAMVDKSIVVPPEPGLMGAFGAALVVKKQLAEGQTTAQHFDLTVLANRNVTYQRPFTCKGGKVRCDRKCEIARIKVDQRTYPFGGACDRFANLQKRQRPDLKHLDLVGIRNRLIFQKYAPDVTTDQKNHIRGRVGFNRSFLVHTYYPLYAHFFSLLGFEPVLPEQPDTSGVAHWNAPFCFPAELAHNYFHQLLCSKTQPDYLFLPHFKAMPSLDDHTNAQVCPLVQGEPFYLQAAFHSQLEKLKQGGTKILSPLLNLSQGLDQAIKPLVKMARELGVSSQTAKTAFAKARTIMAACLEEMQAIGRQALERLERDPDKIGVVLLTRPYSGYAPEAHMGIPQKFASRGVMVIPLDFLDLAPGQTKSGMYWGMGQRILSAGKQIQPHSQLFGTYITNFSCGPDSFIIGYLRHLMGSKPTLTLELDSHTADAGIETRIEAFLDVVKAYRKLPVSAQSLPSTSKRFQPAQVIFDRGAPFIRTSDGQDLSMTNPRVTLLLPSMGELGSQALAAAFCSAGYGARAYKPSNESTLKAGRSNTSCKECLPLILTTGTLIEYLDRHKQPDEIVAYFMPDGSGPCRFGQYRIFMEDLIRKRRFENVAVFSLLSDQGYQGFSPRVHRRGWWAVVVSDVFEDMRSMLLANARDTGRAMVVFKRAFRHVLAALRTGRFEALERSLDKTARLLSEIPLKQPVERVPVILLTGEIFVRRDSLSRQHLTEQLAEKGFATLCTPVAEWIHYMDYVNKKGLAHHHSPGLHVKLLKKIKRHVMGKDELRIKEKLSLSGLVTSGPIQIEPIIDMARPYISPHLGGEAILTIGGAMDAVAAEACGVIAIGPFGCMPNRLSEAILTTCMNRKNKLASSRHEPTLGAVLAEVNELPFMAIESDGSPFPQLQHARLEAFCLQASRLHQYMLRNRYAN